MKTRWILIMIVLIIVAIIISLNSGRKSPGTVLAPQGQSLTGTSEADLETQSHPLPLKKPSQYVTGNSAITIIQTPDKEKQALPAISQPKRKIEPQIRSTQEENRVTNPAVSNTTSEFTSGITKIGKEPTPQEKDEMKSRGIVIF